MDQNQFLKVIQSHVARVTVGPSTVRGRGNAGTVEAARSFLRKLDLTTFHCGERAEFERTLNRTCERLRVALPQNCQYWGVARKVLNLFLRDSLYTTHLESAFHLRKVEGYLELPLDSITGNKLRRIGGTVWPGVRYLDASTSAKFQEVAQNEAAKQGIARVHLDALWWSVGRDTDAA